MTDTQNNTTVSGGKVWVPPSPAVESKHDKKVKVAVWLGFSIPAIMLAIIFINVSIAKPTIKTIDNSITFVPYVTPLPIIITLTVLGSISILLAIYVRKLDIIIMVIAASILSISCLAEVGSASITLYKSSSLEDLLTSQGYTIAPDDSLILSKMPNKTITPVKKDNETVYVQWTINQDKTKYSFEEIDMPEKSK